MCNKVGCLGLRFGFDVNYVLELGWWSSLFGGEDLSVCNS